MTSQSFHFQRKAVDYLLSKGIGLQNIPGIAVHSREAFKEFVIYSLSIYILLFSHKELIRDSRYRRINKAAHF